MLLDQIRFPPELSVFFAQAVDRQDERPPLVIFSDRPGRHVW